MQDITRSLNSYLGDFQRTPRKQWSLTLQSSAFSFHTSEKYLCVQTCATPLLCIIIIIIITILRFMFYFYKYVCIALIM